MISFDFSKLCTGCMICGDVCPIGCISFVEDKEGFIIPRVDKLRCISCHRCEHFCPNLNFLATKSQDHGCYAFYHLNNKIHRIGSSGSFFFSIAETFLNNGGVVYGVELDCNLKVNHKRAKSLTDVFRLMKSKYIQSNSKGIYSSVLKDLQNNLDVLFVGTPCQCYGLNLLVPSHLRGHLLLVDFICHGVPSQFLFDQAVSAFEFRNNCKVVDFSFREKNENSVRLFKIIYKTQEGKIVEKVGDPYSFPFYFGYLNHWISRLSCYNCKFRNLDRPTDLTIGDFWGVEKLVPDLSETEKGVSLVITNTEHGQFQLTKIGNCYLKRIPNGIEFVIEHNFAYVHSDKVTLIRYFFFKHLSRKGWHFCESNYLQLIPSCKSRILLGSIRLLDRINDKIHLLWKN